MSIKGVSLGARLTGQSEETHKNDEPDKLCVGPFSVLPGDDVPLLWRANNDLGGRYLLLVQLVVHRQLTHHHSIETHTLR